MQRRLLIAAISSTLVLADIFQAPLLDKLWSQPDQADLSEYPTSHDSLSFSKPLKDSEDTIIDPNPAIVPGVTADPSKVENRTYDYIIAGGGLAGLTVAAKLVEANFTVLVIESGFYGSEYGPIIDDLNTYGQIFGSSVDHAYETSPQLAGNEGNIGLDKDIKIIRSGNGLGGSTLINGGTWTRPHKSQLDSWTKFGNSNWTWDKLKVYMDEIESPRDPSKDTITPGSLHHFDPKCHHKEGTEGNVSVGARDRHYGWSPLISALMHTVNKTYPDVKNQKDLCCGDPSGVSMFLNTLTEKQVRTDAARSWLTPTLNDQHLSANITVLTGQLVGRVHLQDVNNTGHANDAQYKAIGVEYGVHNKTAWKWDVWARKEVLLASGSIISPLILQWSGIGPKAWLDEAHIPQKLDLPVGYNLQDQTTTSVVTNVTAAGHGQGQAAYFATFKEIFGKDADAFVKKLSNDTILDQYVNETIKGGGFPQEYKAALRKQYENYREWLLKDNVSYAELFLDTDNRTHFDLWDLIPFTRGYVKVLDNDPYLQSFEYNPRYFENELDLYGQAAATRLARQLTNTYDMQKFAEKELVPSRHVAQDATLEDWANYVRDNFRANYHGVGTCSMMSKELGGVVNQKAQVYGVEGLRVVDGSIPPTQVSAHVMTLFYAMAAKIADSVIKDGRN